MGLGKVLKDITGTTFAENVFSGRAFKFPSSSSSLPDISAELARISSLFEQARTSARAGINREAAQGRRSAASNLAVRGGYESPASEHTFGALEEGRLASIGQAEGQLAGQEAGMRAQLLNSLLGLRVGLEGEQRQRADSRRNALFGAGGSLLTTLLLAKILGPAGVAMSMGGAAGGGGFDFSKLFPFLQNRGNVPQSTRPAIGSTGSY